MQRILILNGPNLNLLGTRSPDVYGTHTLRDLERMCRQWAGEEGLGIEMYQSNHEGELIDAKGTKARYVRLYTNGNNNNDLNHYIEVEVYGKSAE